MTRYISLELHERRKKYTSIKKNITRNFTIADIERFLGKIYLSGECWLLKNKTVQRYSYYKGFRAHRVSWELFKGEIKDNLTIDHLCLNKHCVNPNHLEPVTGAENSRRYNAR